MRVCVVDEGVLEARDSELSSVLGEDFLKRCEVDFSFFVNRMLGLKLRGWQWLVWKSLQAGKKRLVVNTSRQIGKSTFAAWLILWWLVFNKGGTGPGRNTKIGIVSRSDDQSKKIITELKGFVRLGDLFCQQYSEVKEDVWEKGWFSSKIDRSREAEYTKKSITMMSGVGGCVISSFVRSFAPTDGILGNTFDFVIEDEASRIESEMHDRAIMPTGDAYKATFVLFSTPNGLQGHFYELMDPLDLKKEHEWDRFTFTIEAIRLEDGEKFDRKLKEIDTMRLEGKGLLVKQEYYGDFVSSDNSFFEAKDIDDMIAPYTEFTRFSGKCDCGVDFGGQQTSRTVVTIATIESISGMDDEGIIKRLYHNIYPPKEDGSLLQDLMELKRNFNIQRFIVDGCPEGSFAIKAMKELGWDVVEMSFSKEKIGKYGEFRAALHNKRIKSYKDEDLLQEMRALSQIRGVRNTMIRAPPGYTDDNIDSFVMATYFFTEPPGRVGVFLIDDGESSIPPELRDVLSLDVSYDDIKRIAGWKNGKG